MAELNLFANNLRRELTCSICGEIFTNPKTLRCLHSFCLKCISDWNASCRRKRRPLTCPSCRSIERLEGNDVSSLPSSFHLQPQLKLLQDMRISADFREQNKLPDCYVQNRMYCQKRYHDKNKLDFYCTTCKECICLKCNATEHKLHRTVTVEEAAEEVKVLIIRDMDRVNKVRENYEKTLEQNTQNMTRIEQETNAAIKEVSDEVEKNIKVLKEHKAAVIETLQTKVQKQKTQNDEKQRKIRDEIQRLSEFNLQGQTLLDENVAHFIVKSHHDISQRCETFLEVQSILTGKSTERNASVRYTHNPQVTQALKVIGKVVESFTDQSDLIDVKTRDVRNEFQSAKTLEVKGKGTGPLYFPVSLAVSDEGEVAIADSMNHRIVIFSADGKQLRHFGKEGAEHDQLKVTFGVAFNKDRLLVTDNNNRAGRLQEFYLNGTYCRTFYKQKGVELFGICTSSDRIAVCYHHYVQKRMTRSGIKVFNKQSGQFMQEIPSVKNTEMPRHIAYGNGKYFVSYLKADFIRVFDSNGAFLYAFGEKGIGDGQFNSPRGFAVTSDVILVCDHINDRVQMLNQDGKFIRSFGKHGSSLGQMDYPLDVAVASDGQVFVLVERDDHCVQVWR